MSRIELLCLLVGCSEESADGIYCWPHRRQADSGELWDRCWASGCANVAAEQPDPRWRGRYCTPCQSVLAADAERIAAEFTREVVSA